MPEGTQKSILASFLDNFNIIFRYFLGIDFRMVFFSTFVDFWSHFRPPGSLFHSFFVVFCLFFSIPVPPAHQVYPPGQTHQSRSTPCPPRPARSTRSGSPRPAPPPKLPPPSPTCNLKQIFGAGGGPALRAQSARPLAGRVR